MKKKLIIYLLVVLVSMVSIPTLNVVAKEKNIKTRTETSIKKDKTYNIYYDSWELARQYETIYYKNKKWYAIKAVRIGDTEKFKVTYDDNNNDN